MRFSVAPIGLQRIVNEMTLHPRPASLRQTFAVETDHPLIQLLPGCPVHAHEGCSHSVTPSLKDLFQDFRRRRQMPPIPTHPPVQRTQPLSDIHDLLVAHRKVATGKRIWVMRASCALAPSPMTKHPRAPRTSWVGVWCRKVLWLQAKGRELSRATMNLHRSRNFRHPRNRHRQRLNYSPHWPPLSKPSQRPACEPLSLRPH